jgi:DNA-binding NtrC family response regulator
MKQAEPDVPRGPAYATPLRILVVDDSPRVGDLMHTILTRVEHAVEVVRSPSAALARLECGVYDVVISELFLSNDLNGMHLACAVSHLWPDVAVILSTGTTALTSASGPMDAVLMKPFGAADLRDLVTNVAATHGGR